MRFFLELSYNGKAFHGWQIQPNASSVQETIERALSIILKKPIQIVGAGRTDAGVHARQMFAHFDYEGTAVLEPKFKSALNNLVGENIYIKRIFEIHPEAHARFDARLRTYKYFVNFSRDPFLREFCWKSPSFLDLDLMNEASIILKDISDFTSFAKLHSDVKTNICDVKDARWCEIKEDEEAYSFLGNMNNGIVFTISSDRFLRNMVRAIAGTIIDVGRKKITIKDFKKIIEGQNRCLASTSMPANALFLWHIHYDYIKD